MLRKKRRESPENMFIVGIEPVKFLFVHQFRQYCRSVDMAACKRLEIQPMTEFAAACFLAKDYILMPYSMHSLSVQSRFIGCDHTREKRLRIILISYGLRTFVHTEIITYSMACPMSKIAFCLP